MSDLKPLRAYRREKKLTLDEFAAVLAKRGVPISGSQLSRIERVGARSAETAMKIAEATGVPVEAVIRGEAA